jgi:histone H3/H4
MSAVPCPVLDDLSRETREERQRKAAAALPAAVAKQMKEEGFRLRFKESYKGDDFEFEGDEDDGDDLEDGWAKETVLHAHRRRLEDIRVAQADTRFAFEIIPFSNFVREVIQDFRTFFPITAEAMEVLQTCAEAHVLEVIRDAYSVAIKRSPVLTADDINTVRQLREQLQGAV